MKKIKPDLTLLKSMIHEWQWILTYVNKYKGSVAVYIILGVVATAMSFGSSVASKYLVDAVLVRQNDVLVKYAVIVISLSVFQIVFQSGASWITAVISTRTNNEMKDEIYSKVIKSNWEEISGFHSGELLNRIEGDVTAVSAAVIGFFPNLFTKLLQFVGSLCIVLYYDRVMALLALLSAPVLVISSRFLVRTMRKYNKKSRELHGEVMSFTEESLRNIQVIKAFDLTKHYIENFKKIISNYRNVKLKYEKFSVAMTLVLSAIGLAVSYLCYGWGIYRLWQGAISVGTMTLFLQIASGLTSSFSSLASLAPNMVSVATSAGRIMEFSNYSTEKDLDKEDAERLLEKSADKGVSVVCENLSFTYLGSKSKVLDKISFLAQPGETIAFVGHSGSGKTTILKILLGLFSPSEGELYISSPDGEKLNITDSTRRFFAYVPQGMSVFSGTIAENLRQVAPNASDDELFEALRLASLDGFVASLENGLESVIGEGGTNLSQGQAQRIAIARAILRKAKVLIMDEATSALDLETERTVLKNIMISDPTRTVIITTHKETMLGYCDRIYRIDENGKNSQIEKTEF